MKYSAVITFFDSPNPQSAISSALSQNITPDEVIIVDDFSSDPYKKKLQQVARHKKVTYLRTSRNLGPAGARNLGIENTRNDFVIFFDDDDNSNPNRSIKHASHFLRGCDLSYLSTEKLYPNGYLVQAINEEYFGTINPELLATYLISGKTTSKIPRIYIPACSLAIRKEVFHDSKVFDSNFRRLEDVDMAIRAAERGLVFAFGNEIGILRSHSVGTDKISNMENEAQRQILKKYSHYFSPMTKRRLYVWYQVRSNYFLKNRFKLMSFTILYFLISGAELKKISAGIRRVLHDLRKS